MPRRAFTLVELLVSIAILAILLSILVTALRSTHLTARSAVDLSNLRQTSYDFAAWSNDHRGRVVNAGWPDARTSEARAYYGSTWNSPTGWGLYLVQQEFWPRVLSSWTGAGLSDHWFSSFREETDQEPIVIPRHAGGLSMGGGGGPSFAAARTEYKLGRTLLTQASAWMNPGAATAPTPVQSLADQIQYAEIRHPSSKGILWHDEWPGAEKGRHHVAFADASVSIRDWREARPTAAPPFLASGEPGEPVDATFNGALGRDF
jgi:prepilin-type N-terminal cleavage/methylation domain-containing protein